ncbi:MAG: ABC transporter ATP-binding protein [Gemmatimonadetes bacterium]|nr:ABC transporter ATP-binding protein [Gemmatimonadota bacterium]
MRPPGPRRASKDPNAPAPSLRERWQALQYVPRLLRLIWETHRGYTATLAVVQVTSGLLPVAQLWVAKLIIDGVLEAQQAGAGWRAVLPLVLLEVGLVILAELMHRGASLVEGQLSDLFAIRSTVRLMEHAATLDLAKFEDPAFYDQLERARRQTAGRLGLLGSVLRFGESVVTMATMAAVLLTFNPWLVLLLAITILPRLASESHFAGRQYALMHAWTPRRRQLDYLRYAGASKETAKEVQLFGLAPWLIARFRRLSEWYYRENRALAVRRSLVGAGLSVLSTIGYYTAYLLIVVQAVQGTITIGSLTFLAASFRRGRDLLQGLLGLVTGVHEEALYLRDLFLFFEMQPAISSPPDGPPLPAAWREGFRFEGVGFRYPGSDRWAVRNLSFTMAPGERVALVGENGAGKTTLTKLLARLYDPTEGRILLDGRDLRDYDLASVRRAIGVIFQDFVRYDMRVAENVGVGEIDVARDWLDQDDGRSVDPGNEPPPAEMVASAEKAQATGLLEKFPHRWRQMLGRRFQEGLDLSGGEWQRIALARAYMRDAQVMILDEPTAALDARAEAEVFQRFAGLMAGRGAVIISHRFSTVRMADRILVLRDGQLLEEGTHDALLAGDGLYRELFDLQASGYR